MPHLSEASNLILRTLIDQGRVEAGESLAFHHFETVFALDDLRDTKTELIRFGFCDARDEPSIRLTGKGSEAVKSMRDADHRQQMGSVKSEI